MKKLDLTALNSLPYFDLVLLLSLFPKSSKQNLQILLSNWTSNGRVIRLSRGRYVTNEAYLKFSTDPRYAEYLASIFAYPAYLSNDYVLARNGVLTEGTFPFTGVTLKEKKAVTNALGNFLYHQIKPDLFTGYVSQPFLTYEYYMATPAKALFDYLYFRSHLIAGSQINRNLIDHLRLNLDNFSGSDLKELQGYAVISGSLKMKQICTHLT